MTGEEVNATDVDPAELQIQLDEIETVMGLQERYPGQGRILLGYGGLVGGFSIALLFVLTWISQALAPAADVPAVVQGVSFFAMAIAVGCLGFVLVGDALAAHRIRRRDRWVFYAGGIWMLAFAGAFPNVEWLRYGGYGTFGVPTIVHALVSYWLLARR